MRRLQTTQAHERLLKVAIVARTEHFVLHRSPEMGLESEGLRASVLISKRHVRHAVTRNLIRRQLDALIQEQGHLLVPTGHLLRLVRPMNASFISASSRGLKKAVQEELRCLLSLNPTIAASPSV